MTESTDKIVNVMIGEPLYSEILEGTPIRGTTYGEPVAQKTKLGYCLAGAIPSKQREIPQILYSCRTSLPPVEQLVKQFWDLEHIGIHPQKTEHFTLEEELAMEKVQELTIKKDGHWTTGLLWKPEAPPIKEMNYGRASAIMHSVEKKLTQTKLEQVNQDYTSWMDQEFAEPAKATTNPTYYLGTHPVFEMNRNTKCRVVMNAASKDKLNLSLNDQLLQGPSLHSDKLRSSHLRNMVLYRKTKKYPDNQKSKTTCQSGTVKLS